MLKNLEELNYQDNRSHAQAVLALVDLINSVYEKNEEEVPSLIEAIGAGTQKYLENNRFKEDKYYTYISYFINESSKK